MRYTGKRSTEKPASASAMEQITPPADFANAVKQYEGKSQNELMDELLRMNKNGVIDKRQLEAATQKIAPMLDAEQRERLESILAQLR